MTEITNIASPGAPSQVVAESPIRQPLAGGIAWSNHAQHPAVAGYALGNVAQIQPVPVAAVDLHGGKLNRR